jgi:hypothetical protein
MIHFKWKIESLAKGVDLKKALIELEKIEKNYNGITRQNILDVAKNKKSALHNYFTWDDTIAAEKCRLREAADLINNIQITVVSSGQKREVGYYEIIKTKENKSSYKNISTFDQHDIEEIKLRTIRSINQLKSKLCFFKEFNSFVKALDSAIKIIE